MGMIFLRNKVSGAVADAYAIGGASPELVAAFLTAADGTTPGEYFRTSGSATTFGDMFTFSTSNNRTMFDSTGTLVWAPHNLFTKSNTTFPAVDADLTATEGYEVDLFGAAVRYAYNTGSGASSNGQLGTTVTPGATYTLSFWAKDVSGTTGSGYSIYDPTNSAYLTGHDFASAWPSAINTSTYTKQTITFTAPANCTSVRLWVLQVADVSTVDVAIGGVHCYRSDLGGMADNPDMPAGLEKYVPTTTAAKYLPRRQAYRYNSGWELAGMQMEAAAATNLFDYSTDFSNAAWGKTRGAISSDAATGLDGNTGNFLFTCNTTSALGAFVSDTVSVSSGTRYCFWAVLEYSNVQWVHLRVNDGSAIGGWFDIQNGATGSTTGSETNGIGIVPIGSGKYLCYVDFTPNATTSATFYAWIAAGGDGTLNCVSGDAFYCYHMQMEVGSVPSSPIITTGSTVPRAAETLTIAGADSPISATEATLAADVLLTSDGNGPEIFNILAGSAWVRIYPRNVASTYAQWRGSPSYTPEVLSGQGGLISAGINQPVTVALGIKANDEIQLVAQGNAGTAVATTNITDFSGRNIGITGNVGEGSFFYKTIRIWSTKLSAADLVTAGTAS